MTLSTAPTSFSLLAIRTAVIETVYELTNLQIEEINNRTSVRPSQLPGEHPIQDIACAILVKLGFPKEIPYLTLRGVHNVGAFVLWAERVARYRKKPIVTPSAEEIRTIVMRCIKGHYRLANGRTLDNLTIIDTGACSAIAEELVLTAHQLPKEPRMTLHDLLRWVGDAVMTRTLNPPPEREERRGWVRKRVGQQYHSQHR